MQVRTRKTARASAARLIREFEADPKADPTRFRALMRAFSVLLAYDNAIEAADRLDPAAPPDPTQDEPDLNRLNSAEQEQLDRLWLKSRGIGPAKDE